MALAARPASFGDTGPPEIEGTQDVAAEVSASAILLVVTQVIASLSPEDQVVVCLRYYSGLEDSDIADATGLSRDGVKELLERSAVAVHEAMMRAVRG
jgi:DNA-directed RNA polymerase specialized sigma24 family protein